MGIYISPRASPAVNARKREEFTNGRCPVHPVRPAYRPSAVPSARVRRAGVSWQGRPLIFGKTAAVAVVGNEDGAHRVIAEVLQALNDVGFSVAAASGTYWVGEAMGTVDYDQAGSTPDTTGAATRTMATNTAHLAHLLTGSPYPPS
jgi:hypothetical protein